MIRGSQTKATLAGLAGGEQGVSELVREMDQDYIVALADRTFRTTAKQADVTVTPNDSTSARANVLAEKLQELYWSKLGAMLDCVKFGRVAFEKVWSFDPANSLNTVSLDELPYDYTEMLLDENTGAFNGVKLRPKQRKPLKGEEPSEKPIELSAFKSWWLALDPTPLNPHGKSRYVGAPSSLWRDRKETFRLLKVFIRRFVLGGGIAHIPDQIQDPDDPNKFIDGFSAFCTQYEALLAGGVLAVSNEREPGKDGAPGEYVYNVEKLETQVRDGRPLLDIIAASDSWVLLAFGFPPKTILEGDSVGSFALVSMQMLLLWSVADEIVDQVTSSFQEYVVNKAAALNGVGELTVNYVPLTERPDDLANELMKAWLTNPALSPLVAAVDLDSIFEAVGIQVSAEGRERLKRIQATLAMPVAAPPVDPAQVRAREPAGTEMHSPFLRRVWR